METFKITELPKITLGVKKSWGGAWGEGAGQRKSYVIFEHALISNLMSSILNLHFTILNKMIY